MNNYEVNYLCGEDYLKSNLFETVPVNKALCAFERLRFKIVLTDKRSLSEREALVLAELYLLDKNEEIPYYLAIDLSDLRRKGNKDALYLLAIMYQRGVSPFGKDLRQAISLLEAADKKGKKEASLLLGECFFKGIGCSINYDIAEKHLKRNLDSAKAKTYLGYIYYVNGKIPEGLELLSEANEEEEVESYYYLGEIYNDQKNSFYNKDKALLYFRLGSDNGDKRCHYPAGKLLSESTDNRKKLIAETYLKRGKNDKNCLELLGDIAKKKGDNYLDFYYQSYLSGGDEKKYGLALLKNPKHSQVGVSLLKQRADTDSEVAFSLYQYYLPKNRKTADMYLRKAADLGNEDALILLGQKEE